MMTRKTLSAVAQDLGPRQVLFKISDESTDRDEDILVATGCNLTNFMKNPQFLGFHNYGDFPFGKVLNCWVDPGAKAVFGLVYFPTIEELSSDPANVAEHAKRIDLTYNMYKNGLLSAVSVGFGATKTKPNPESESGWGKIIEEWELYEFSAVPVPANANALAMGVKSGKITEEEKTAFEDQWKQHFQASSKSGRRISTATQAILDKIVGHHEDMNVAMGMMTKSHAAMADCMKDLVGSDEPDDDGNDDEDDDTTEGGKTVLRIVEK